MYWLDPDAQHGQKKIDKAIDQFRYIKIQPKTIDHNGHNGLGKMLVRDGNRDRSGNECANQDSLWHRMGYSRRRDEAEKGVCQSSASEQT